MQIFWTTADTSKSLNRPNLDHFWQYFDDISWIFMEIGPKKWRLRGVFVVNAFGPHF